MEASKKKIAIILISVIGAAAVFLLYYFFLKPEPGNPLVGDGLTAENAQGEPIDPFIVTSGSGLSSEAGQDLLILLNELKSIELDTTLVEQLTFNNLSDFSHTIKPQEVGRSNPFAPVGSVEEPVSTEE